VHVLTDEAREEYDLEGLWATHGDVRRVETRAPVQTLSTMRL
jgi:ribosomal silencing factor RsfS